MDMITVQNPFHKVLVKRTFWDSNIQNLSLFYKEGRQAHPIVIVIQWTQYLIQITSFILYWFIGFFQTKEPSFTDMHVVFLIIRLAESVAALRTA